MSDSISAKRTKAIFLIAGAAGANIVFSGAPKPTAEIPAHIVLTGADFVMCAAIYHLYFGENISKDGIVGLLGDSGVLLAVAGGGGYAVAKTATGAVAEVANFLGPLGWMATGLLAAGGTALIGLVWMGLVDSFYRRGGPKKSITGQIAKQITS